MNGPHTADLHAGAPHEGPLRGTWYHKGVSTEGSGEKKEPQEVHLEMLPCAKCQGVMSVGWAQGSSEGTGRGKPPGLGA